MSDRRRISQTSHLGVKRLDRQTDKQKSLLPPLWLAETLVVHLKLGWAARSEPGAQRGAPGAKFNMHGAKVFVRSDEKFQFF